MKRTISSTDSNKRIKIILRQPNRFNKIPVECTYIILDFAISSNLYNLKWNTDIYATTVPKTELLLKSLATIKTYMTLRTVSKKFNLMLSNNSTCKMLPLLNCTWYPTDVDFLYSIRLHNTSVNYLLVSLLFNSAHYSRAHAVLMDYFDDKMFNFIQFEFNNLLDAKNKNSTDERLVKLFKYYKNVLHPQHNNLIKSSTIDEMYSVCRSNQSNSLVEQQVEISFVNSDKTPGFVNNVPFVELIVEPIIDDQMDDFETTDFESTDMSDLSETTDSETTDFDSNLRVELNDKTIDLQTYIDCLFTDPAIDKTVAQDKLCLIDDYAKYFCDRQIVLNYKKQITFVHASIISYKNINFHMFYYVFPRGIEGNKCTHVGMFAFMSYKYASVLSQVLTHQIPFHDEKFIEEIVKDLNYTFLFVNTIKSITVICDDSLCASSRILDYNNYSLELVFTLNTVPVTKDSLDHRAVSSRTISRIKNVQLGRESAIALGNL